MITVECTCGAHFQVFNERVAERVRCPKCGARASDLLGAATAQPSAEAVEPQFQVPCAFHPDHPATHNCMNCAKPLCIECVRERGYYCSDECKQAVEATEPDAVTAESRELAAVAEQVDHSMETAGIWAKRLAVVALVITAGWIGVIVWQKVTAPKGQLTVSIMSPSFVDSFNVRLLEPDLAVLTVNDELSAMKLSSGQKLWTIALSTLEEKWTPPKRVNADGQEVDYAGLAQRDELRFADATRDHLIVHSSRQIIDIDPKTSAIKWKFFEPTASIHDLVLHTGGVWCGLDFTRSVNLSLADGSQTCAHSNQNVMQSLCAGGLVALLSYTPKPQRPLEEQEELTAGSANPIDVRGLLAAAQGKPAPSSTHSAEYRLQFVSATDGHVLGEQSLALSEAPRLERVGDLLCVLAGHELVVLGSGAEQKWKATLPATPRHLAGGGGLVIVATEQGVAAFDATTGQSKWNRTGLNAENVAVGPDSGVYVTIELSKDQAGQGEPAKFRKADIQRGGMGAPLPPFTALVKLDPRTGKTRWGVRNIGRRLYFEGDKVFVVDPLEQTNFLANQIMVGGHSVRCLSARSGKEFWSYVKTGDLHHSEVAGSRVFLVTADDAPGGRIRTSCNYQLQLIEGK